MYAFLSRRKFFKCVTNFAITYGPYYFMHKIRKFKGNITLRDEITFSAKHFRFSVYISHKGDMRIEQRNRNKVNLSNGLEYHVRNCADERGAPPLTGCAETLTRTSCSEGAEVLPSYYQSSGL